VRSVKPSAEQVRLIGELKRELITSIEDQVLEVNGALAFITRAHQINGGMFSYKEADKWYSRPLEDNPKIDELFDVLEECSGKVVIWCRYRGEIAQVVARLEKEYGDYSVCQYHGGYGPVERALQEKAFAEDPAKKFMVANQQTGAMGVDFSEAELMVYFSNTFNFEDRQQSEERATSIAKANKVFIVDIVLNNATDRGIIKNLSDKKDIAEYISENIKNAASLL
jgi:SNF2 family DNA or RNA helicase